MLPAALARWAGELAPMHDGPPGRRPPREAAAPLLMQNQFLVQIYGKADWVHEQLSTVRSARNTSSP